MLGTSSLKVSAFLVLVMTALFAHGTPAVADAGWISVGGNPHLLSENPSVSMKSEIVDIMVSKDLVRVDSRYVFVNEGQVTQHLIFTNECRFLARFKSRKLVNLDRKRQIMSEAEKWENLRILLRSIINGEVVDPIMQVPNLHSQLLLLDFDPERDDKSACLILGIDSELREFPFDPGFRSRCHPEFLARMDQELVELKKFYKEHFVKACEDIYERIKDKPAPSDDQQ